jgi:predicted AlkP superfamily phosphohydrolase/phosphomutase
MNARAGFAARFFMFCVLLLAVATLAKARDASKKVIVLGFDGMDYGLTRQLLEEGRLPNFARLEATGGFTPLGTSIPPQSPVAWSNFITGTDSGGHGIFDFIHRDPATMFPYLSTTRTEGSSETLKLGKWQIPISGGKVELLRRGEPFWEKLERRGVETTVIRMPANFPPSGTATREISGMGTPDILGTYGTFSFFTTNPESYGDNVSGGHVYRATLRDGMFEGTLNGPDNPFLVEPTKVESAFTVYVDPVDEAVMLVVGDQERVLTRGEWTEWLPLEFPLVVTQKLHGMARFYLKAVRPDFELYVSPVNIDPLHPAMPVSTPDSYAGELAKATGLYYTQGMPEDTKALTEGIFDRDEFLAQATIAGREFADQYRHVLDRFESGFLFYYFGNVDQISHMMWRTMDPDHPAYDAAKDASYADVIPKLYEEMDAIAGYTLDHMDENTTLIVMSDHGFTSWRRSFNLNSWLRDNGYLALKNPNLEKDPGFFRNVNWPRTKAYGLGLNGLYLNMRGRERQGSVSPNEREALLQEISEKLLQVIDPATSQPAITKVYRCEEIYDDLGQLAIGPDIQVGYAKGTRSSNQSSLGEMTPEVLSDNLDEWSGDHCMDHEAVPGILLTSRPLQKRAADLKHLAASILAEFEAAGEAARR